MNDQTRSTIQRNPVVWSCETGGMCGCHRGTEMRFHTAWYGNHPDECAGCGCPDQRPIGTVDQPLSVGEA